MLQLRDLIGALATEPAHKELEELNLSYINTLEGTIDEERRVYQV